MNVNAFNNALPIIANSLADTLGVKVMLNAGRAATNGNVIYLPSLDARKEASRRLALGYIAHESAHVRFSNFKLKFKSPLEKHLDNILEDIRIEKSITEVFPGCQGYLADTVSELVATGGFGFETTEEGATPTTLMQQYMLYQLRQNVLGQQAISDLAQKADEELTKAVRAGMKVRLDALMYQVEDCESEAEVLELVRAIIKMMEDEAKKEEEKEKEQEQSSQDQNQQGKSGQDQSQSDGDEGDDQQDGQSQQSQGQSGDESQQGDQSENGSQDGDDQQDGQGAGSGSSDGDKASEIIKQILSAGDDDAITDMGSALEELLGTSAVDSDEPSASVPFANVKAESVHNTGVDTNAEMLRVGGASNALRVRAQALLQAQTLSTKRSVMMGTKLNCKNLHQAKLGGPVFQKTKKGVAVDTAIALLVDRSGSMSGIPIQLAMDAALATTLAFQRPDVKTAVFTFPFHSPQGEANGVLKDWNALPSSAVQTYATIGTAGSTPLAEGMMGAGMALMQRKEARKILLVATDGEPDNRGQAKWVIDLARKSGIEVLGLGIRHDTSSLFGARDSAVIHDIVSLPTAMIGMLDNIMLKKAA